MSSKNEEPIFYTTKELSEKYRVRIETVRRWLRDETLEGIKMGGLWRIPKAPKEWEPKA